MPLLNAPFILHSCVKYVYNMNSVYQYELGITIEMWHYMSAVCYRMYFQLTSFSYMSLESIYLSSIVTKLKGHSDSWHIISYFVNKHIFSGKIPKPPYKIKYLQIFCCVCNDIYIIG